MLVDITSYLQTAGVGTLDTDLFYGDWPDDTTGDYDTATVVRQYAGEPPDQVLGGEQFTERPGLQVMCRSKMPSTAMANIYRAFNALDGLHGVTVGDTDVHQIQANQSPAFLYTDDNGRAVWVVNFSTVIAR